ncbi:MAG: ATP-dependent helicase [Eubacterium sp.]|nr:ATP-dependent helicase [Eubacterium sp.]MBQ9023078.1 ATP-dependent helicase [Eubacterium sp.]
MLVVAGPGSGKTTVITHRILNLIRQEHILPGNILVITFTKAAANEMKSRFLSLSDESVTQVTFGTFHAIFYKILGYSYRFESVNIIGEGMQMKLIMELCRRLGMQFPYRDPVYLQIISSISRVKNGLADPDTIVVEGCSRENFDAIFKAYQNYLNENRYLDFDDLQIHVRNLFLKRPDVLAAWQKKYQYILVDEFQDCAPMQYEIIRMLAAPQNNLFLVGDDDQSIYSFRGATPALMQQFLKDYTDAKQVTLGTNYRSNQEIIKKSYQLITCNRDRISKKQAVAFGSFDQTDEAVVYRHFQDQRSELVFLRDQIRKSIKEGLSWNDLAILTRTNAQLSVFYDFLDAAQIPCVYKEAVPNLYAHWVAEDLLSYLKAAVGRGDKEALIRIMNRPNRFLSRKRFPAEPFSFAAWKDNYTDQEWMQKRITKLADDLSVIGRMRPFSAVNYILKAVGYEEWMYEFAGERNLNRDALADTIEEMKERAKEYTGIDAWLDGAEESLKKTAEMQRKRWDPDADGVHLMTYHAAKGLEYTCVFLPDLCDGIVPYHRAVFEDETEEERRMLYVAMTRAKEKLFFMTADEIRNHKKEPSPFLEEIFDAGDL